MARPVRIEYPGAFYYISSKGVEGEAVFNDVKDRQEFLQILQEVIGRMQWEVFAYNLLPDSFQLLIKTPKPNLSKGMRQLNGIYTQRYNVKYDKQGNIFHGRFKAVLVEEQSFIDVAQHVLHMPILRRKARKLDKWKWCSYQATAGLAEGPEWLNTEAVLSHYGKQKKRAQTALIKAIAGMDKDFDITSSVQGQILLGSDSFVAKWKKQLASGKVMDKARQRKAKKVKPLSDFGKRFKDIKTAMVKAYETGNYTLDQIGTHFGVHYSTVSRTVKKSGF
ncbi:MAG: transposase family protein [gamma proteobacterium symbiont of Bathyaustriella thionipta]|nr:transposase family protein [gamma proteobacterium symbiont of Bathyaustriella thionipta]MCU7950552.1 transposase family protein [gamma proteobacterium symbiont of Bathyaustriella thionipta]MCU7953027.1 transposase family protein [gamma proteobacterium symbiont of Bathyaustriella thionipta]MCU7957060.1 transposase family protein [gamma proteobacterium symbiont of Bathyaustriella thionipta]MCU7967022.1 transposase family protein [gamma proteobacterium symbiont of Bathyaustriella thionipta]